MQPDTKHKHKKSYYNDIALRVAHNVLGIDHLHYGYFGPGLKPELGNLKKAQDAYLKNLLTFVPKGVKRVFDVGCGTGSVAKELVKRRYELVCLAPDPYLTEQTFQRTGGRVETITDLYENVTHLPPASFDMVLMSESCQYIKVQEGWEQNARFLKPGGWVLIADFFKIRDIDRPGISKSGHNLTDFLAAAEAHGFKLVRKVDITSRVAPTMDIFQGVISGKIFPVLDGIRELVERRYPLTYRLLRALFHKKAEQLHQKYSNQGSEIFCTYKGYFVLLFKKVDRR